MPAGGQKGGQRHFWFWRGRPATRTTPPAPVFTPKTLLPLSIDAFLCEHKKDSVKSIAAFCAVFCLHV